MPEDLRTKEEAILAKKKENYELDLSAPAGQARKAGGELSGSSASWWQRPASFFSRRRSAKPKDENEVTVFAPDKKNDNGGVSAQKLDIEERRALEYNNQKEKPKTPLKNDVREEKDPQPKASRPVQQPAPSPFREVVIRAELPKDPGIQIRPITPNVPVDNKLPSLPKIEEYRPAPAPAPKLQPNVRVPFVPKRDFSLPVAPAPVKPAPAPVVPPPAPAPVAVKEEAPAEVKEKGGKFHQPEPRIRARFLDGGGGVDLIPAASRMRNWQQIGVLALVVFFLSAIVVGAFYGALYYKKREIIRQLSNSSQQISELEKEILSFSDLNVEIKTLGDEIKAFNSVLSKHVYWTNFFNLLERYTVQEVYYSGFSAGNDGAMTLKAVGKDYNAVARQLKVLGQDSAKEFVSRASISSAQRTDKGIEFDVIIVLNPNLFYFKE